MHHKVKTTEHVQAFRHPAGNDLQPMSSAEVRRQRRRAKITPAEMDQWTRFGHDATQRQHTGQKTPGAEAESSPRKKGKSSKA